MTEIKQNQSTVLFPHPWNLFNSQCFSKVQTPILLAWAWPSPGTRGMCRCVIDSAGPRGSKYHWGVNSPGGLLISYSSISLFSSHWVNESLCFLSCVLRNSDALRAIPWLLYSFCCFGLLCCHLAAFKSDVTHACCTDAEETNNLKMLQCHIGNMTVLHWNVECQDFQVTQRGSFLLASSV